MSYGEYHCDCGHFFVSTEGADFCPHCGEVCFGFDPEDFAAPVADDEPKSVDGLTAEDRELARELVRSGLEWKTGMRKFVHALTTLWVYRVTSNGDAAHLHDSFEYDVPHVLDKRGDPDEYPDLNDDATIGVIEGMIWPHIEDVHIRREGGIWYASANVITGEDAQGYRYIDTVPESPAWIEALTRGAVIAKLWLAVQARIKEQD